MWQLWIGMIIFGVSVGEKWGGERAAKTEREEGYVR
jgi:hypothetical protein